jgi:hypothetical protein
MRIDVRAAGAGGGQSWLTIFQAYLGGSDPNFDVTYVMPSNLSGAVLLRVRDTNHAPGAASSTR